MGVRATMLELAVLGELDRPTHGYELRRRLSESVGTLRRLSFGSLYPALHRLEAAGFITAESSPVRPGKRALITYTITTTGRDHLARELEHVDSDDESFSVALGLMSKATPAARLRLLRERRARVTERREAKRAARSARGAREERDPWKLARRQYEDEIVDREIRWLNRLIAVVQAAPAAASPLTAPPPENPETPGAGSPS